MNEFDKPKRKRGRPRKHQEQEKKETRDYEPNPVASEKQTQTCPRCGSEDVILLYISSAGVKRYKCMGEKCKNHGKTRKGRNFVVIRGE